MSSGDQTNAVISAANLLMVSMLKLNRVLVPAILRLLRSARGRWVRRSSRDIASEISAGGHTKKLCVGSCCGGPLASIHTHLGAGASMAAWSHPNADATDPLAAAKEEGKEEKGDKDDDKGSMKSFVSDESQPLVPKPSSKPASASVASASAAPRVAGTGSSAAGPSTAIAPSGARPPAGPGAGASGRAGTSSATGTLQTVVNIPGFSSATNPLDLPQDELYFRMRVMEEERHRANQMNPAVFTSVMNVYFTLFTMMLYAFIIISVVLINFHFSNVEAILFSFSLLATATISEAETLLQPQKKKKSKAAAQKKAAAAHQAHHSKKGHHHGHHHGHHKHGGHPAHAHESHAASAHPGATTLWLYRTPDSGDTTGEGGSSADPKPVPWGILSPYGPKSGVDPSKAAEEEDNAHHHHDHHGHHGHAHHLDDDFDSDDSD